MEAINSKAVGSLIQGIGEDNYSDLSLQIQISDEGAKRRRGHNLSIFGIFVAHIAS
ncbi:hypothetical protein PROFUN_16019 [Planoprotostelium fungivorum]|uniref:Uncharacterized protein n=1 Tax=Planoprotostelium fungivorum TaxID=1890364 RepID=A0A2P6MT65_9EUKA|nr:hypothetical protein PROFUN_16019 [Planoprotostelium fungivorum]